MIGGSLLGRVLAYGAPADLRKGFEGLSALVKQALSMNPLSGDYFLFVNRGRKRARVLYFDGTGLCVLSKRLDKGQFAALWRAKGEVRLELTSSELNLFLEGCELVTRIALSPPRITEKDLAVQLQV